MSRRQRPSRRLASSRAARRRRQLLVPPERLPASTSVEARDEQDSGAPDYDDLRDLSFDWEPD